MEEGGMGEGQHSSKLVWLSAFLRKPQCPLGALWLALYLQRLHLPGWNNRAFDFPSQPFTWLSYNRFVCVIFSICVCAVGSAMVSARGRADRIKTTKENDRYREKKSNIKKKDERPQGVCRSSRRPFRDKLLKQNLLKDRRREKKREDEKDEGKWMRVRGEHGEETN